MKQPAVPAAPEEFTVPPESIVQGGSYRVDPVAQTVTRVEFTRSAEEVDAAGAHPAEE